MKAIVDGKEYNLRESVGYAQHIKATGYAMIVSKVARDLRGAGTLDEIDKMTDMLIEAQLKFVLVWLEDVSYEDAKLLPPATIGKLSNRGSELMQSENGVNENDPLAER